MKAAQQGALKVLVSWNIHTCLSSSRSYASFLDPHHSFCLSHRFPMRRSSALCRSHKMSPPPACKRWSVRPAWRSMQALHALDFVQDDGQPDASAARPRLRPRRWPGSMPAPTCQREAVDGQVLCRSDLPARRSATAPSHHPAMEHGRPWQCASSPRTSKYPAATAARIGFDS
jgi:hypothetical protein